MLTPTAYQRSRLLRPLIGRLISRWASRLDAFSAYPAEHSYPALHLAAQLVRAVRPTRSSRTGVRSLNLPTPTTDRDRTVLRRSEPSSRATLMGEQPNPWDLLQPQDVTSRHRGAKPPRRFELLGRSACYPRSTFYPLSDGPSIRNHRITFSRLSTLIGLSVSQSSTLILICSSYGYRPCWGYLCKPPLHFWRWPPQSNCPPCNVRPPNRRLGLK